MDQFQTENLNKNDDIIYSGMKKVLNFYDIPNCKSSISCHGKPTKKDIKIMKDYYKINMVLTLLHEKEKPVEIENYCIDNSVAWRHIALHKPSYENLKNEETQNIIADGVSLICKEIIENDVILFVHCAAGVHRTGTIIYLILRTCGDNIESAMKAIESIRLETYKNVGQFRLDIAEKYILPKIINKMAE